MSRQALFAFAGGLPAALAQRLEAPLICEMEGMPTEIPDGYERLSYRVETLGTLLQDLKARGVAEVVFAGGLSRPAIDPSRIDAATMPLVPRLMGALGQGDDATLRAVIAVFEGEGFAVRAPHEVAPALLPPEGVLGAVPLPKGADPDAKRGAAILAAMGAADVGQACVVRGGLCLAVEALPGTDWMLDHLGDLAAGGMLCKGPKPGQDRRVDLPVIGPGTVARAAAAGLTSIVIEAGGVMVLEREAVIAAADAAGIALWVRPA
ncbi:LpxI family protein [Pseudoroseicyclus aestuarii]|uniref:Phosphatidate cytidylyltransferase n=1 Tax=Pseudoroseicyclus aestuarii TaxID=1795041 RepID=A0A318SWE8_9RHOB|nr:UDP-2,3-diacylglucosamine diphosphatase LpxI [Pseudoroseicyclus aestuarii]PYE86210.1 hypothetical protein DFP88_101887 [Pseudoroseicyclus aestuarii]